MTRTFAPISALLLSTALLLMGNGLQGVLLPVRGALENFSPLDLGVLGGSYFLGFASGCLHGPSLVRRVGHIRVFAAMVAIASAVALAHPLALIPVVWWTLRVVTGYCFAILYMVIESWLNERSTTETRGFVFSIYTIINLTVMTIGQMMIVLGDPAGLPLFSLASILISVAAVPVSLSAAAAPAPAHSVRIRLLRIYRISPVGFVGCLAVGLTNGAFWALGPVYAQSLGMDTTGVALFMSSTVIMGALGQWPLGRASDRVDRRKVIALACAGAAVGGVALTAFHDVGGLPVYAATWMFGFFVLPIYALSVAHTNDFTDPEDYVEVSSGLLLLYAVGAVFGPLFASAAMALFGPAALFSYTSVCSVLLGLYCLWRMMQRARAAEEDRADFADSIRLAQTVGAIDPLSEEVFTTEETEIAGGEDELVPEERDAP